MLSPRPTLETIAFLNKGNLQHVGTPGLFVRLPPGPYSSITSMWPAQAQTDAWLTD